MNRIGAQKNRKTRIKIFKLFKPSAKITVFAYNQLGNGKAQMLSDCLGQRWHQSHFLTCKRMILGYISVNLYRTICRLLEQIPFTLQIGTPMPKVHGPPFQRNVLQSKSEMLPVRGQLDNLIHTLIAGDLNVILLCDRWGHESVNSISTR